MAFSIILDSRHVLLLRDSFSAAHFAITSHHCGKLTSRFGNRGRLATSKATNPEHSLSSLADGFSWGECASFFEILADGTTSTVDKRFIEYWFRKSSSLNFKMILSTYCSKLTRAILLGNERLPTEIGWQRRKTTMQSSEREKFTRLLKEAAGVA